MKSQPFLKLIEQSNLLPQGLLAKLTRRLVESSELGDPQAVARWMVDKGHLTVWQAQQLLAGRNAFYLGRYRLLDRIGKGGMGVVFKAQHAMMERVVALKVMSPALLRNPRAVARFNREVKAAAALQHPNIITAFDADAVGSTHFLVMEYVDGHDLNWWLRTLGPMPISLACECAMQAAEGLAHAHHQGMVHRDIKPVNLLVAWNLQTELPVIKILDMGLARFVSESQEGGGLTRLGQAIGTPDYIAPEAAENFKQADIRADLFSLGCTLFKLLTGRLPFGGENTMEKLMARAMNDAPPIRAYRPLISESLELTVARLLARRPVDRYQTPSEVVAALRPHAASTIGEKEALRLLARDVTPPKPALDQVVANADASLNEFFRDFSVSPVRDDGAGQHETLAERIEFIGSEGSSASRGPFTDDPGRAGRTAPAIEELEPLEGLTEFLLKDHFVDEPADELEQLLETSESSSEAPITDRLREVSDAWQAPNRLRPSMWDSPLLMIGGGILALLVLSAGALVYTLGRESGDVAFQQAEAEYKAGNYTQAVGKFSEYLERHPNHIQSGQARVHRGLARIRQSVDTTSNWLRSLEVARTELAAVAREREFTTSGNELSALLPKIAEGLAAQARATPTRELLDGARAALDLVDKYVLPKSLRPADKLGEVEAVLALAQREYERRQRLEETSSKITALAAQGDLQGAEAARRELLRTYPDLQRDPKLVEALQAVSAAAQRLTRFVSESREAVTTEPESPVASTTALAVRTVTRPAGLETARVYALGDGSAYALSADDGRVQWRRFVGHASTLVPLEVTTDNVLVFDSARQELQSLQPTDGALRWRCPMTGALAGEPMLLAERLLVATRDGRLTSLDVATGKTVGHTAFPEGLMGMPAIEPRGRWLYQMASHSHFFVLDPQTLDSKEVIDLGHAESTVAVGPTAVSRFVVVCENHLARGSRVRVLLADEEGLNLKEVQQVDLDGHVVTQPKVADRFLYVFTDRGGVIVFTVATADQANPLTKVIETLTGTDDRIQGFPCVAGQELWIGDDRLTKFAVQAAAARMAPQWTIHRGDVFVQPPTVVGSALITVRKRKTFSGTAVAAVGVGDGKPIWETQLGSTPTDAVLDDPNAGKIWIASSAGAVFELSSAAPAPVIDAPLARVDLAAELPRRQSVPIGLEGGILATPLPAETLLRFDPAAESPLSWITPPAPALAQAVPWNKGLLVPCRPGWVQWLDSRTGKPLVEPFQPRVEVGQELPWTSAAVLSASEALISDGRAKLYRLGIVDQPQRHLAVSAETDTPEPLVTATVVGEKFAVAVDAGGHVVSFQLSDLALGPQHRLKGRLAWGPRRVGNLILVATEEDRLLALGDDAQPVWEVPLSAGPLVGLPRVVGDDLLMATQPGRLLRLAIADGQARGQLEVGQPLAGGPIAWGTSIAVIAHDGSLLVLRSVP